MSYIQCITEHKNPNPILQDGESCVLNVHLQNKLKTKTWGEKASHSQPICSSLSVFITWTGVPTPSTLKAINSIQTTTMKARVQVHSRTGRVRSTAEGRFGTAPPSPDHLYLWHSVDFTCKGSHVSQSGLICVHQTSQTPAAMKILLNQHALTYV